MVISTFSTSKAPLNSSRRSQSSVSFGFITQTQIRQTYKLFAVIEMGSAKSTTLGSRKLNEEQIAPEFALKELFMIPEKYTKTIHFVRHGEGYHNVAGAISQENYKSWDYFDAHLTEIGWKQAAALKMHLAENKIEVDVVIVSPMSRALETAVGVFGGGDWVANGLPPLMVQQNYVEDTSADRPAISAHACPPFIAVEMAREQLGCHPCDKRRSKSHIMSQFPGVDFSLIELEEDVYYSEDVRETPQEIQARGHKLIQYIMSRPEKRIAVVSHAGFLRNCLGLFGKTFDETIQQEMHGSVNNCEMRTMVLAAHGPQIVDSPAAEDRMDYRGKAIAN
eukprot:TRINITY_DN3964_c0_g3_i1.p2 TRINITY_DN3964_c0_g3~~TRINITY_DN3964_c0_g3_i1.p2  ORF type:complete len:336 (+),score=55.22 TRINITY_DN3964_c0_g3_i1:53-1060(+)